MCFQDFLRSIPGSLLCSELHEEWMDLLDEEEEEEEQVQDIKRCTHMLMLRSTHLHPGEFGMQNRLRFSSSL